MFSILIGRIGRPCRNEIEVGWMMKDRKELLVIVTDPRFFLNDGEKDILAKILSPSVGTPIETPLETPTAA